VILPNAVPDKSARQDFIQICRQTILGYFHYGRRSSCIQKTGSDLQLIANHPVFKFEA
jgi:hypothetical protein